MESKTTSKDVRLRFAACLGMVMLSVDALNPIKVICSILNWNETYFAWIFFIMAIMVYYANAEEMSYFSVKVFLQSIFSIFFSSMEVLGKENIPLHGPIIFTGNHMNQFVDAAVMLVSCPHRVGFLIAEKSFHSRIVGDLAKLVGAIPVSRPQDKAKKGPGKIYFDNQRMIGSGTAFSNLQKGDKIRPGRSPDAYRVKEVISDEEAILAVDAGEPSPIHESFCQGVEKWVDYDILGYIDQAKVFSKVHDALGHGQCLGIFPEGGSHDNTDLLPLKVGVAVIAFGVMDKYDTSVPIVPVGLNYFRGHRFRGRVVVEFGEPIRITKPLYDTYKSSKRAGLASLLSEVEDGMRSVIVTASSYEDLKLIHTVRRLYQRSSSGISTIRKQDLARRFAAAYRIFKEKNTDIPADLAALQKRLELYQDALDIWGLKDYQVQANLEMPFSKLLYIFFHGAVVLTLASIPSIILNAPVGLAATYWATQEAKKDLKASRVKVHARDVLLSKKITFSLVAVPVLWITYAVLMLCFSNWEIRTVVVVLISCPLFSYLGVMAVEAGMVDLKDLRPAFLRLLPGFQHQSRVISQMRASLQKEVRTIVKKYGPDFGPLYYEKSASWEQQVRRSTSSTDLMAASASSTSLNEVDESVTKKDN